MHFSFKPPIAPDLSPNATAADWRWCLWQLLKFWRRSWWIRGEKIEELHTYLRERFGVADAFTYDSGRSALLAILRALKLQPRDAVVLQAFTCIVVPNAVLATGAKPVYMDIDQSYNLDPETLEKVLQQYSHVKAVIVQHTFGYPAQISKIKKICQENKLWLIEDCAHATGVKHENQLLGTFGDAALFSFGRDKMLSTVSGGAVITNNGIIAANLRHEYTSLSYPNNQWIAARLRHPLVFLLAKRCYYFLGLGKFMIYLSRKLRLLPDVLNSKEKTGNAPPLMRLPNICAEWALRQFKQLNAHHEHRTALVKKYNELWHVYDTIYPLLRYPIRIQQRDKVWQQLKQEGILLGDWYRTIVAPLSSRALTSIGYVAGSCPRAEAACREVLNLPTNLRVSDSDANLLISKIPHLHDSHDQ